MDPFTLIAGATAIAKELGIGAKLGRLLGGDRGAEIGSKVLSTAQAVTGAGSTEEALQMLSTNQQHAHDLRLKLLELEAFENERDAQDRASARAMQVAALAQDDLFSKRFVYYFAGAWSLFSMAYLVLITVVPIPEDSQRFADTALGFILGTVIATIIVYFYGSSKGSATKDSNMRELIDELRTRAKK